MSSPQIRPALPDDLVSAAQVYQAAASAQHDARLAEPNPWHNADARAIDLRAAVDALTRIHEERPEAVQVIAQNGIVIAVGAVVIRERHAHILFLFVDPTVQDQGFGRMLLDRLQRVIVDADCEVVTLTASEDRRAWRRYLALGLHPGAPIISMRAPALTVPPEALPVTHDAIALTEVTDAQLAILAALDAEVKGATRSADIRRWFREEQTSGAIVTRRETGEPVGYALISIDDRVGRIGPVVARTGEDFDIVLRHALQLARGVPHAERLIWRCDLPGANQRAIRPLMRVGFTPWGLLPWFATSGIGLWDRYVFRDEDQL